MPHALYTPGSSDFFKHPKVFSSQLLDLYNIVAFLCLLYFPFFSQISLSCLFRLDFFAVSLRRLHQITTPCLKYYRVCILSFFLILISEDFLFFISQCCCHSHLAKKSTEKGNGKFIQAINYENMMWRKRLYLPRGALFSVVIAGFPTDRKN